MKEMNELIRLRRKRLDEFAEEGINPFPNDFKVDHTSQEIKERFKETNAEEMEKAKEELRKAGYEWDDQGRLYYPAPENDRRWIDSIDHYKSYETHSITWRKK